ncbi:MAG: hypothetical protein HOE69_00415 [Euryarchaeota archaeon]|jgi:hypothetical protein|nr:hypothetical protein [Euryarchaeota archaeon]
MQGRGALTLVAVMFTSLLLGVSYDFSENQYNLDRQFKLNFAEKISPGDAWVTSGGGTGADMAWDMVLDAQGNSYVTGSFAGSATFGSTTLNSQGGLDGFVAKMDDSGNWLWAAQIAGIYEDWGLGIDVDSSGNVYVTGPFMNNQDSTSPSVQLGSFSLNAHSQSTYDMFVGKLDSSGNWQWAQTSDKQAEYDPYWGGPTGNYMFGQVMPTDIKVFNNSITVTGSYVGNIHAYTNSDGDWYYASNQSTSDAYLGSLELNGAWESQHGWGGPSQYDSATSVAFSPSGNYWYIAGTFQNTVDFMGISTYTSSGGSQDIWLMQITDGGSIEWIVSAGGTGTDTIRDMVVDNSDSVYAVGDFEGSLAAFGTHRLTSNSGGSDVWTAKISVSHNWDWAKKGGGPSDDMGFSIALSPDESAVYTVGHIAGQTTFENTATTRMANTSGASDAFVAVSSASTGEWEDVFVAGGPSGGDRAWAIDIDSQNITHTAGRFKGTSSGLAEFGSDDIASAGDYDVFVWKGLIEDDDDDRVANEDDDCPTVWGNATVSPFVGCPDTDGDGYADVDDSHPLESTQWRDSDGDGYGDNPDGFEADNCTAIHGTSTIDQIGCEDSDSDGWSNSRDAFPSEFTQWNDSDGDQFGDNWNDESLTSNYQSLGLGGYVAGAVNMDYCPTMFGVDTFDNPGCPDTDLDGWSDVTDDFINNPTQHIDTDDDGWGDNHSEGSTQSDFLPFDETQYQDNDGDGWGDNQEGNNPDEFPNDETQQTDIDGDGYGDNLSGNNGDACPDVWGDSWRDVLGCPDVDGDGTSDDGDMFPSDWSQWADSDGDGQGDNWANPHWNESRKPHWPGEYIPGATNTDKHPLDTDGDGWEDENATNGAEPWDDCVDEPGDSWQDRFGCPDRDGDGWSDDNDVFEDDSTQWRDSDRDGFGDELGGLNGDDCPTIRGDSEHDRLGCPDTDTDGWSDPMDSLSPNPWNTTQGADLFPADPLRWNQSHVLVDSNSGSASGGLAAGLGLGALIAMMFVMVFAILVMKLRQKDHYDDEYEDYDEEDDEHRTSRAAEISRSWQEHGTAPPPAPEGAEMITTAGPSASTTEYVAPPASTADNTIAAPVSIPAAPTPPSEPLQSNGEPVMDSMDTSLAMSLLGGSSEEESNDSEENDTSTDVEENSNSENESSDEIPVDDDDPWA